MGCTSSAPNMANNSTADKSIQFDEESSDSSKDVDEIIYRAANDINVLPSCDTLPEPIHLVRNKSTLSLNHEKENPENGYVVESHIKAESSDVLHHEDKVSRLEEVVDKVVQLHVKPELVCPPQAVEKVTEEHPTIKENTDRHNSEESKGVGAPEKIDPEPDDGQDKEEEEKPADTPSPSRSESSRATRWEALADIAAELPPSLTVDPITGQIYALSK